MKKSQIGAFLFFGVVVVGCTSLLGDFEVSPTTGGGTDAGACTPGTPGCTAEGCTTGLSKCGDTCVDTQTSAANCGGCARACPNGLACSAGNCQCPDNGAFCDGQCYPRTDRQHCGPTCISCAGTQVCDGKCVDPPAPAFEKVPLPATGWRLAGGGKPTIVVKDTMQPGTIYECRTAPLARMESPNPPPFAPCDGGPGTGRTHTPVEDPSALEGTYRTDYRYKLGPYTSPVISHRFYVHTSLDNVAVCPRPGVQLDGPHFSDAQVFAAVNDFLKNNPPLAPAYPTTNAFPPPGQKRTDDVFLENPWIRIKFSRVRRSNGMQGGQGLGLPESWPPAASDYILNERSLRHAYVMSPDNKLLLVKRMYIHPKTNDCKQVFDIGNNRAIALGPPGRGERNLECEALVLNSQGAGLCVMPGAPPNQNAPVVVPVDFRGPPNPTQLAGTFNLFANNPTVQATQPVFNSGMQGKLIQFNGGQWFKIAAYFNPQNVTLTQPWPGVNATGTIGRIGDPAPWYVIDTGYAKLHPENHAYATGKRQAPYDTMLMVHPSPHTKCEVPGCNTGRPWLTYLPP